MKVPVIGTCKLCLKEGVELRDSHILPRWTYKRAHGKNSPPVLVEDGKAFYSSDQATEYMLCDDCEDRFGRVERKVSQLVYPHVDARDAPLLDRIGQVQYESHGVRAALPGTLDTSMLAYFGASVLWRASVSRRVENCQLGTRHNEAFRRYLLEQSEFPQNAVCVVSFVDVPLDDEGHIVTVCSTPVTERMDSFHGHRFTLFGLWYLFAIGNNLPRWCRSFCTVRSQQRFVMLATQSALVEWIGSYAASARPVGRLARGR